MKPLTRVVAELGFTQTPASLAAAVHWWLESSGTTVELVITIKMLPMALKLPLGRCVLVALAFQNRMTATPITRLTVSQDTQLSGNGYHPNSRNTVSRP